MRAKEFIIETRVGSLQDDVAKALPATYAIPELKNQDPYLQYRFGVAIAGAKGKEQRTQDNVPDFHRESPWGENQIVVSFDPHIEEWLIDALQEMGMKGFKRLSTPESEEADSVGNQSPINKFKGFN